LCPYNPSDEKVGGLNGILCKAAQNFEVFQKCKIKIKNKKPIAVDVFFKAYPTVPLSCRI
jgi:hypothetical protein